MTCDATGLHRQAHSTDERTHSVGVCLAIGSGVLIGSSFVFKKKGLLSSQKGHAAGEGVAYLKSASRLAPSTFVPCQLTALCR